MNTLGHIPKHRLQHEIINYIEAYVNETILMSMRCSNQHRPNNILKAEAMHMISIINSNFKVKNITQPFKHNHFEPTILTKRVYHSKPKQIAYDNETYYHGYEIYQPTQISSQTQTVKLKHDNNHI